MRFRTRRFQALDHDFAVRTDDGALAERIDWAYGDLASEGTPVEWYEIPGTSEAPLSYRVTRDGATIAESCDQGHALAWLQWEVNRAAAAGAPGSAIHAAAACGDAGAVLVVGRSGAGKSTVVAELVRAGMSYLTDEAVAFDGDGRVRPYAKPLSLAPESLHLLALGSRLPPTLTGEDAEKRLVPASLLGTVTRFPAPVALIAFPERRAGATPSVEEVPRARALLELLGNLHGDARHGPAALSQLAAVVRGARCLRIVAPDSAGCASLIRSVE